MTDPTDNPTSPAPCPEREEALALHVGRDLPPADARELEVHLEGCPGCRFFLDELEESRSALTALAAEAPPAAGLADVHRRVMEEVRAGGETGKGGLLRAGAPWRWAAAAAVVLALGAALVWRLGPGTGPESPGSPADERVWIARSEPPESSPADTREAPTRDTRQDGFRREAPETPAPEPTSPDPTPREPRPTAPNPETEIRRASADDRPDLKIQLVSDDPDIVIYWLVDMEEPTDAPTDTPSTT